MTCVFVTRTLDPPFRSRFQARVVEPSSGDIESEPSTATVLELIQVFNETMKQLQKTGQGGGALGFSLPHFPFWSVQHVLSTLETFPECQPEAAMARVFPYVYMEGPGTSRVRELLRDTLYKVGLSGASSGYILRGFEPLGDRSVGRQIGVRFDGGKDKPPVVVQAPMGHLSPSIDPLTAFYETERLSGVLAGILQDHSLGEQL